MYHYAGNNPVRFVDPDGERIKLNGSTDNIMTLLTYLNKYSYYKYAIDENGYLYKVGDMRNGSYGVGKSILYSNYLDKGIDADLDINIYLGNDYSEINEFAPSTTKNIRVFANGGITTEREPGKLIDVMISPEDNFIIKFKDGEISTTKTSAEVLIHEITGHAVPIAIQKPGNGIVNENEVRRELHLRPREIDNEHVCYE